MTSWKHYVVQPLVVHKQAGEDPEALQAPGKR